MFIGHCIRLITLPVVTNAIRFSEMNRKKECNHAWGKHCLINSLPFPGNKSQDFRIILRPVKIIVDRQKQFGMKHSSLFILHSSFVPK